MIQYQRQCEREIFSLGKRQNTIQFFIFKKKGALEACNCREIFSSGKKNEGRPRLSIWRWDEKVAETILLFMWFKASGIRDVEKIPLPLNGALLVGRKDLSRKKIIGFRILLEYFQKNLWSEWFYWSAVMVHLVKSHVLEGTFYVVLKRVTIFDKSVLHSKS